MQRSEPLDVPFIAVERDGALYALLDPRATEVERRGPDLPCTAHWRLLVRSSGDWTYAGAVASQTEGDREWLVVRVQATIARFDGRDVDGFRFSRYAGPAPGEPSAVASRDDAAEAERLREICREIVLSTTNAEQASQVASALSGGAEYVLEMRDDFDRSDYYVPVPPGVDPHAMAEEYGRRSMQRVMGILRRDEAGRLWPTPDE